jgi:hypothetical protein
MFVRTLLTGLSCAAIFSSVAAAQCGSVRYQPRVQFTNHIVPIIAEPPAANAGPSSPSITELARNVIDRGESRYQSCEAHRVQSPQWASRSRTPTKATAAAVARATKQLTPDELATAKFRAAHDLWQAGRTDAARRWLEVVVRDYATTPTADRARVVLAKL